MAQKQIRISAAVIINQEGETLLVRKSGTQFFMQPGGKIDQGEQAATALVRELQEELKLTTQETEFKPLGTFSATAANEANHEVVADLFLLDRAFDPEPANEIAEAIWTTSKDAQKMDLAPLTRDYVMPILDQLNADLQ